MKTDIIFKNVTCCKLIKRINYILFILICVTLCGCSYKTEIPSASTNKTQSIESQLESNEDIVVNEYKIVGGIWAVEAVIFKGEMINLKENDSLNDLYGTIVLTFEKDGSYSFIDSFITKGTYKALQEGKNSIILIPEEVLEYNLEEDDYVVDKVSNTYPHLGIIRDDGLMEYCEYDPIMEKTVEGDIELLFRKR